MNIVTTIFYPVLIQLILYLVILICPDNTYASVEIVWKYMGMTKDRSQLVYYNPDSVSRVDESSISLKLKRELSDLGKEEYKKEFYKSLKEAEDKSNSKVSEEGIDDLIKELIRRQTLLQDVVINCKTNEIRYFPNEKTKVQFITVTEIEANTVIDKIKNELCKD